MKMTKLLRLTSGEEILCDVNLNGIDTDTIIITDPIILIPAGEGKIGFMPFMPYTEAKDGLEIDQKFVMFMVDPVPSLLKQHKAATTESLIQVPLDQGIITNV